MNEIMELPRCKKVGHGQMVLRPIEKQTYEQKFCGTWYDCPHHDCYNSVLFESQECANFLKSLSSTQPIEQ